MAWGSGLGAQVENTVIQHQRIKLGDLIQSSYGLRVIEWNRQEENLFREAVRKVADSFNSGKHDIDRTNEVGILLERKLEETFGQMGINCSIPSTKSGRVQHVGYPDLTIVVNGVRFYIEVKTFSTHTISSSQRTFYFTVSDDPKVIEDAVHLLLGFEIQKSDDQHYQVLRYHIVDLIELPCKVKVEYNASNRDLYQSTTTKSAIVEELEIQ